MPLDSCAVGVPRVATGVVPKIEADRSLPFDTSTADFGRQTVTPGII
jgi:hypothetical protein